MAIHPKKHSARSAVAVLMVCLVFTGTFFLILPVASGTEIHGYSSSRHDRFASGGYGGNAVLNENAFFSAHDFSGVGRAGFQPITMITPVHGLAAAHFAPAGPVTFVNRSGDLVTRTVASTDQIQDSFISSATDLLFVTLDSELVATDKVATYSLTYPTGRSSLAGDLNALDHAELLVYGKQHAVGRNELDGTEYPVFGGDNFGYLQVGQSTGVAAVFDHAPATGFSPDETIFVTGDSGHPDFLAYNDDLVLFGLHWAIGTSGNTPLNFSTFAPYYWPEISALVDDYNNVQGTAYTLAFTDVTVSVPEPDSLPLFCLGGLLLLLGGYRGRFLQRTAKSWLDA
jgi:hypothetical protein